MRSILIVILLAVMGGAMSMAIAYLLRWMVPANGAIVDAVTMVVGFCIAWICFQMARRRLLRSE